METVYYFWMAAVILCFLASITDLYVIWLRKRLDNATS